jgi:hypothetical protein
MTKRLEQPCTHRHLGDDIYEYYQPGFGRMPAYPCLECGAPVGFYDAARIRRSPAATAWQTPEGGSLAPGGGLAAHAEGE